MDDNLLREFKKRIDKKKLKEYAKRYPKTTFSRIINTLE